MRGLVFLLIVLSALSRVARAQEVHFVKQDYSEVGLTFMVPASWEHDGLLTTTKAAFIKHFGWTYDKPDANDIWSAVGSFSSVSVDSTLLPYDSAFEMHKMNLYVNRAQTLYKRWLCLQRKIDPLESKPLINGKYQLVQRNKIRSSSLPPNLSGAKGIAYQYDTGRVNLITYGHIYTFIHQEKCYEIKLESTTADPLSSIRMHELIINSVERFQF